jgi:tetratricopeptide (TPR) repeat protein
MNRFAMMDNKTTIPEWLSPSSLNSISGDKAYQFGREYFDQGAVRNLSVTTDTIHAQVVGTATYRVVLRCGSDEPSFGCTCPRAGDGYFCKHCVAVGLAWLASKGELPMKTVLGAKKKRRDPWGEIQTYLRLQEPEVLIALVLDAARGDDTLYRSLLLKAERSAGGADLAKIFRASIKKATTTRGYVAWDEAGRLVNSLHEVVDSLAELLQPTTSGMLVELLEYAVVRVETMLENVDDSDGGMGDIVERLGGLHLEACRMSGPDPVTLAERLFQLETTLPLGIFNFDTRTYRDVLGEQGVQCYRELALAQWRTVGANNADDADEHGRLTITRIMEHLAEDSGDIEQLVEIKSRELSCSYHYFAIANIWRNAGKMELALEWAERGLKAFPDQIDYQLREFLVALYLRSGREDDALRLTWAQFEDHPILETYTKLASVAGQAEQWPVQRERALALIDATIAARFSGHRPWGGQAVVPNYSLRVAIAIWEQDLPAAWHYANIGQCDQRLLIALAGKLATSRLDDALVLYRRVVSALIEATNNAAYEQAIGLVQSIADALSAHQRSQELAAYVEYLRVEFKRKRNFITLLDRYARA